MDAPRIQYCTTPDGVNIAFWVAGEGPPLIYLPPLPQHPELEWEIPDIRNLYEWLTRSHRVVRLDVRNTGLSQRGVADRSVEALGSDLDAVVGRLGLEGFAMFGHGTSGGLAISYAALHPERIDRLVLVNATVGLPGVQPTVAVQALQQLLDYDWETYTEVLAGLVYGWSSDVRGNYAHILRESFTVDDARLGFVDVGAYRLLAQIAVPTLIVHHRDAVATTIETGRRLAAAIPDARLVTLEGRAVAASFGDPRMVAAVDEFLGAGPADAQRKSAADEAASPSVTTVLFTDLESSTATTQRLGDAAAQELVRAHNDIVRAALGHHGGREIKHTGDGIMASFGSPSSAVECAIAIQRAVSEQPGMPRVRIGLNAGEPIAEDGDLFGTTVQLARRICDQTDPGEVLVSNVVRELSAGKGFLFADAGVSALKGFDEPVRLYELRWQK